MSYGTDQKGIAGKKVTIIKGLAHRSLLPHPQICLRWIRNGCPVMSASRQLYPRKRTSGGWVGTSEKCH
jgi:hypothetical protein